VSLCQPATPPTDRIALEGLDARPARVLVYEAKLRIILLSGDHKWTEGNMNSNRLTDEQLKAYAEDGYLLVRGMLNQKEVEMLGRSAREDRVLDQHSFGRADGEGGTVRLSLWNHPTDTIYGMIARSESVVGIAEQILGGEVYHYHSKMIMKDAKIGGAWAWHQDYGYWYENGVLFPDLTSASIAVDKATKENGCLQVIRGSHKMGRVDHVLTGDQAGANMERVAQALERLELVYVEMEPGDALFFHANLLHRSDQNRSDKPRWSMICCYNAARNDPYKESHHPRYAPLTKVADEEVLKAGNRRFADAAENDAAWLVAEKDKSATGLKKQP
jgi:ectoine hydroxylase